MKIQDLITKRYEGQLKIYGDCHLGVEWPNKQDAKKRYDVMLECIENLPCTLLDFGCGLSGLYERILEKKILGINYSGLDLSDKFIKFSIKKFPEIKYYCCDILDSKISNYDYIICNGVFTVKDCASFESMWTYVQEVLKKLFLFCNKKIAVNFTTKHVDYEKDKLFHLPFDDLSSFLVKNLTRNFTLRQDYGLYEYTAYIMK
jgi:SAM-dependent methyltransferase